MCNMQVALRCAELKMRMHQVYVTWLELHCMRPVSSLQAETGAQIAL